MKNTKEALAWITEILNKHNIPFRVSGGFAAKIYGSTRELADIDIGMKKNYFPEIISDIEEYLVSKPGIYKDKEWDLFAATLNYKGQEIDLVDIDSLKFFNRKEQRWEDLKHTFSDIVFKEVCRIKIPVISRKNLIDYKIKLGREVDIIDIKEMLEAK